MTPDKRSNDIVPVVLAGGSGTRLWPLSRESYPKQFLAVLDDATLLQQTLDRLEQGRDFGAPLLICSEAHRFLVSEQAEEAGCRPARIVVEPEGRNTAPALTVAALLLRETDPVLVMTPADHYIGDEPGLRACLARAADAARGGAIVTLGVVPDRPETGFGYIRLGDPSADPAPVASFTEKPDAATARGYLESGDHLWNSGIFVMRCSTWLRAIETFRPDIHEACAGAVAGGSHDGAFFRPDKAQFLASPAESVDYAVMEPASGHRDFDVQVISFAGGWSDIGSWQALWERSTRDAENNATTGNVVTRDTRDSLILAQGRLVSVLGGRNLVVAETPDAVLVADLDQCQGLGDLVKDLKARGDESAVAHRRVYRPWGHFDSITQGPGYQVKRLAVKPGKKLSLQLHHHRSEHWVVVRGTASVVRGEDSLTLQENESVYIPRETRHRLGNDGKDMLEVIEVQTGDYLGEDDIVRFDDDFGRVDGEK